MTVTSLLIRRPNVKRAAGVEPDVPPMTGLISKRVKPNSLLVARCAGALDTSALRVNEVPVLRRNSHVAEAAALNRRRLLYKLLQKREINVELLA